MIKLDFFSSKKGKEEKSRYFAFQTTNKSNVIYRFTFFPWLGVGGIKSRDYYFSMSCFFLIS